MSFPVLGSAGSCCCAGPTLEASCLRQHCTAALRGGGRAQADTARVGCHPSPCRVLLRRISVPTHFSTVPSTAGSGLSHRALSWGARGCSLPCAAPVPDPSWPPAALKLPGPGTVLGAHPSRFLSGTRAGKPGDGSLAPQGGGTSPGQGGLTTPLLLYCLGSCRLVQEGAHPSSPLRPPALSTPDVAVLSPKEPSTPVPSGEDTSAHRLGQGLRWQAEHKCRVPSPGRWGAGCATCPCHYWGASDGGGLGGATPCSISRPCPQSTQ